MIVRDHTTAAATPQVVRSVCFDPWPFADDDVQIVAARRITVGGALLIPGNSVQYRLSRTHRVLVELADGFVATTTPAGLSEYLNRGGQGR